MVEIREDGKIVGLKGLSTSYLFVEDKKQGLLIGFTESCVDWGVPINKFPLPNIGYLWGLESINVRLEDEAKFGNKVMYLFEKMYHLDNYMLNLKKAFPGIESIYKLNKYKFVFDPDISGDKYCQKFAVIKKEEWI